MKNNERVWLLPVTLECICSKDQEEGGGGVKSAFFFFTGRPRPKVQPCTLIYTLYARKGTPFIYLEKWCPFQRPSLERYTHFMCNLCKTWQLKMKPEKGNTITSRKKSCWSTVESPSHPLHPFLYPQGALTAFLPFDNPPIQGPHDPFLIIIKKKKKRNVYFQKISMILPPQKGLEIPGCVGGSQKPQNLSINV